MKTLLKLTLLALSLAMILSAFAACGKENAGDDTSDTMPPMPTDPFGVVLSVQDATPTGLTLICTQSGGSPTGELHTTATFRLQQKVYDNWVYRATLLEEDEVYNWPDADYVIPKDGSCEITLAWSDLYGTLPAGSYRLAKSFTDVREDGTADAFTYFAEFEITE